MAGWDTDCNAGNVGTIMGVACGLQGLPQRYRAPINDGIVCSGISGYLNILDIPTFCREVAMLGYRLAGEEPPKALADSYRPGQIYFDFELPGSTHNIRVSDPFFCRIEHSTEHAYAGTGSLSILMDRMVRGDQCKIFYKPFYTRDDFSDARYSPVFSPTVYPGQTVSMKLYLDQWNGNETPGVAPYIRTCSDQKDHLQGYIKLVQHQWIEVSFTIPDTNGDEVDEVGIVLEGYAPASFKTLGKVYLDEFTIQGKSAYTIDIKKVSGGLLVQDADNTLFDELKVVTKKAPTDKEMKDLEIAMKVVKHTRSNAIVFVKDGMTIGIGPGQTNRIWAVENAIRQSNFDTKGSVMASDAFFPFDDCVTAAAEAGVTAIIQPGGSIRDQESIDKADETGIAMIFSGYRHFKH